MGLPHLTGFEDRLGHRAHATVQASEADELRGSAEQRRCTAGAVRVNRGLVAAAVGAGGLDPVGVVFHQATFAETTLLLLWSSMPIWSLPRAMLLPLIVAPLLPGSTRSPSCAAPSTTLDCTCTPATGAT